jgi:PAS domain S-box-containing protein
MTRPDAPPSLRALDRSTDRFGELIAAVPAVIYEAEVGLDARWHYVSPQIEALLGDSPEDWIADPNLYTRRIHPADRDAVFQTEGEEAEIAQREQAATVSEYRMLHADDHLVWVRDEARLVENDGGTLYWRGSLVDITIERTARNELEDTYQRHRSDRLAAPQSPAAIDVFRITCRDCGAVHAAESPQKCPACGGANVVGESMEGLTRQLTATRSSIEDLLDGIHRHLEFLGISLYADATPGPGGRRILVPLHRDSGEPS